MIGNTMPNCNGSIIDTTQIISICFVGSGVFGFTEDIAG
jgi:hypothetical protein